MLASCITDYWAWVCTNKRVLKYRPGESGAEELHDVSYEEISGISLVNIGRNDTLGGYGAFSIIIGMFGLVTGSGIGLLVFTIGLVAGSLLIWKWMNSESSHFELRGSGLITQEPEKWRIDQPEATDKAQDVQKFVKTVRGQL